MGVRNHLAEEVGKAKVQALVRAIAPNIHHSNLSCFYNIIANSQNMVLWLEPCAWMNSTGS